MNFTNNYTNVDKQKELLNYNLLDFGDYMVSYGQN